MCRWFFFLAKDLSAVNETNDTAFNQLFDLNDFDCSDIVQIKWNSYSVQTYLA